MAKWPRGMRRAGVLLPLVKEEVFLRPPDVPTELKRALDNTLRYGNPMGAPPRKRAEWVKSAGVPVRVLADAPQPVDVLWFVECYPSYTPRGQEVSRATAHLFTALGIDYAILANEEKCAGECSRLVGEAGVFGALADYNVAVLRQYRVVG